MKKWIAFLMAIVMIDALAACGTSISAAGPTAISTAEATAESGGVDETAYEAAKACIGEPVAALYAAVGQPESSTYGTSCLVMGAQDGTLTYQGFTVWTIRTENSETVQDVTLLAK